MRDTNGDWVVADFASLTGPELYGILQLRSRIFVVEQECAYLDLDGVDTLPGTHHLFLPQEPRPALDSHGGGSGLSTEPAAYARILPEGFEDGPAARPGARSVGRVATDPRLRGTGLGHALMRQLVSRYGTASRPGTGDLTLNAQAHLAGYYGRHGFSVSGEEFDEDGIPHLPMHRPGAPAGESPQRLSASR